MSAFLWLHVVKHKSKSVFCCVVAIVFNILACGKSDFINKTKFVFILRVTSKLKSPTMIN